MARAMALASLSWRNETAEHAAERSDQQPVVDLLRDQRPEHLRVSGRLGECHVPREGIEQSRVGAIGRRGPGALAVEHRLDLVTQLPDGGSVDLEDEGQVGRQRDPEGHGQVVADEETLPRAKRQGLASERDLLAAPEDQAQHGFVERGLERTRSVLLEEHETAHRPNGLAASWLRKLARSELDESFHVHGQVSRGILDHGPPAEVNTPGWRRFGQAVRRNKQARRTYAGYGLFPSNSRRSA
jgi:hypothetical protein